MEANVGSQGGTASGKSLKAAVADGLPVVGVEGADGEGNALMWQPTRGETSLENHQLEVLRCLVNQEHGTNLTSYAGKHVHKSVSCNAVATYTGYAGRRPLPWLACNVARAKVSSVEPEFIKT